jgi:sigma-B regulation protein RsbU (phosphoserine phosphatase)
MMLRVYLVDDEPPARARMRQLLSDVDDVVVVGESGDAVDARAAIAAMRPDVVFLDIEMPQVSGTVLAQSLPEPRPFIVFATAFDRYAIEAFAVEATDYLVKPVSKTRLASTLARVRERLSRRSDLERDLAAASATQAALLPRSMPRIAGFEAAAVTRQARGVGGDFFVAQQLSPRRFVLALGDVAGKGLPASLIASSVQARIETVTRHANYEAADIVADVNRALCNTLEGGRYATLAYLEIDTHSGHLTLVNAGHLPALLVTHDAPIRQFSSTAPVVGLFPEAQFAPQRVTMAPGSALVMYSDGITEAFDAEGEEFGEERLADLLARHATASPEAICEVVLDAVRQFTNTLAHDDITVLALQKTLDPRTENRTENREP